MSQGYDEIGGPAGDIEMGRDSHETRTVNSSK
jgi:hypothetical protein